MKADQFIADLENLFHKYNLPIDGQFMKRIIKLMKGVL